MQSSNSTLKIREDEHPGPWTLQRRIQEAILSAAALPLALVQLVAALLEKSPARRPAGMPAVRAVLEEILRDDEQLPGRGSVDGPATIAAPRRLRRPGAAGLPAWLVYAGGLVLLACLAGVLCILPKLVSERPVVRPPPPVAAAPESAALPPPPETVAEPEPAPAQAQAQEAQAQEARAHGCRCRAGGRRQRP